MELMRNGIQRYDWGSRSAIPALLGLPPANDPQAEMWIGAHPAEPSVLESSDCSLITAIAHDPVRMLGESVIAQFGPRLPYLLKVLAADRPLSLQAHPSAAQAALGYARENAAGVPVGAPTRNYKDPSHKPELICALTEFHGLYGFRDPEAILALTRQLAVPRLQQLVSPLQRDQTSAGMSSVFSALLQLDEEKLIPLLADVRHSCHQRITGGSEYEAEYQTVLQLSDRFGADAGVLVALLMNRITLRPGTALYVPARKLHAYLSGVGVEIMANSDNVLRGGLTAKHVDLRELTRVLDFSTDSPTLVEPIITSDGEWIYQTPSPEFRLSRIEIDGQWRPLHHPGPQILLAVDGDLRVRDKHGDDLTLGRGRSIWIPAADQEVSITGRGTVFRAIDGVAPVADMAAA
jgi:mannose-6-phosphate isomerase